MNYIIFVENYIYLEGTSKQMPLSKKMCPQKTHPCASVKNRPCIHCTKKLQLTI